MFKDLQDMKFTVLSHYYDNEQLADAVLNTIHRATNAYMFNEDKEFKRLYKISKVIYGDFVHLHINKKVM
jgi:methyltransferase-like protein